MSFITTFERFTNCGQIFKIYSINCPEHPSDETNKFLPIDMMTEIYNELTSNEPRNKYDNKSTTCLQILRELKTSKFIGHSSIMFIINMNCDCRSQVLHRLFSVAKRNKYLRNKPKVFLASYHLNENMKLKPNRNPMHLMDRFYKYFNKFPIANKLYPKANNINFLIKNSMFKFESKEMCMSLADFHNFEMSNLDNTIFIQYFTRVNYLCGENINNILHRAYEYHTVPMQQTLIDMIDDKPLMDLRIISTSSNADLYFYSINPALAFIINNYYFTSDTRLGSEFDVINLIRALKILGIPYVLIEDSSKDKLLEILEYLKNKDFYPLHNILFCMMSHGRSGNVIRTHDGQLDINDIVEAIQSNKSLKNVVKLLLFNNCRGSIHLKYADQHELQQIKPTDGQHLQENTVVVYSVPDQVKSFRSNKLGCPFPRNLSIQLKNSLPTDTIDQLFERVNAATRRSYFNRLKNCIELVRKNPKRSFHILPLPAKAAAMLKLIHSIKNDMAKILNTVIESEHPQGTQFYLCGTQKKDITQANPLFHYYFSSELDMDQCAFVDEPDYEYTESESDSE